MFCRNKVATFKGGGGRAWPDLRQFELPFRKAKSPSALVPFLEGENLSETSGGLKTGILVPPPWFLPDKISVYLVPYRVGHVLSRVVFGEGVQNPCFEKIRKWKLKFEIPISIIFDSTCIAKIMKEEFP